ncbi:hypothetical protein Snoj_28200 [Streptomyces nojiriensis]|uniref:Anti-sigma factor NepR domain-containing protein n=1 Tax=Streptomyces nojiriensis TaxID=66374 RepID=A0ABQ3SLI9_9ACTN|nr:hypothetical protein [Streptomyces nojiriensis]QTI42501.1 hypothetical protein JYK04_00259 [Streptomyces nojiriensis]GGS39636.1 hypothetical protein GCM10010205_81670 [Streptomyces nojiriensis]GHI68902.1 hypothetical protein Snoj_28200 [Streptomyces nojiriensis]
MAGPAERTAYAEQLRKEEVFEALHPHVVSEFVASLDARDPGRPAPSPARQDPARRAASHHPATGP